MRQVGEDEVLGPLEPVAQLASDARQIVEAAGIRFAEATDDHGEPGPTQWAVVELDDGSQFLLVHHHAHPERFVELKGQIGTAPPAELAHRFVAALGLGANDVTWVADSWPHGWPPTGE
jgi:hypothetical protein